MQRNKLTDAAIYIFLIVAFLASRLPGIGSFVTLDEPSWLSQGANFYYALGQREFENTVYEYQPAVTTMEIITAAMLLYFPEYRALEQGYLSYEKGRLDLFMLEHGYDPLVLLVYARVIQILVLLVLFLVLYYLLQRFLPKPVAIFSLLFASFDPFHLSQTRLLDHEAMVSMFVLVSLLSFALYLFKDNKLIFLILSGASAGFAQLSKSSAIAMLAALGILLLISLFDERKNGWGRAFLNSVKTFGIWFLVLAITYFVFWPGMWTAPGKMLYQVYGNAFSYAFQGARLTVTEELNVSQFSLNTSLGDLWELTKILFFRTTPWTWLGILFGFALPFYHDDEVKKQNRLFFAILFTNALAFILLIGLAQGRNSPHYILTSYLSLNLLAGLGWYYFIQWFADRFSWGDNFQYAGLSVLVILQMWSTLSYYPYYFTYRNPISYAMGENRDYPQFPYGEGLEIAAQYLAQLPDAKDSTAFVYYSRGCFSYYYPGLATSFRPYYIDGEHAEDLLEYLQSADYLVVYTANQGKLEKYHPYLNILSQMEPMHEIRMNGYLYVQIYEVDSIPQEILDQLADL